MESKNNPLLRIIFDEQYPPGASTRTARGLGVIGMRPGEITGYPNAKSIIMLTTAGIKKRTVIHEFGHVAGLGHEHLHPDAYNEDPKCSETKKNQKPDADFIYTPYDRHSAMNYCTFSNALNYPRGLSPKDVELLRSLYP
jgi:hypothetical protein